MLLPHAFKLQVQGRRPTSSARQVPRLLSEPAIAGEIHTQGLLLSRAQRLQWGTAGASVVAKPVHDFLQPRNPEAPSHRRVWLNEAMLQLLCLFPLSRETQPLQLAHLGAQDIGQGTHAPTPPKA